MPQPAPLCIAAVYGFAPVGEPDLLRDRLEAVASAAGVLGTLLVAGEGVNGTIAGASGAVEAVLDVIRAQPGLTSPEIKYAAADAMPFHRLKVRRKSEIVTMGRPDIAPSNGTGVYVSAGDWNALITDPATVLIDTRNAYEGEVGAFAGAVQPNTATFRDFPAWFESEGRKLLNGRTNPKVAMYCTGGIRCEKATAWPREHTPCAAVAGCRWTPLGGPRLSMSRASAARVATAPARPSSEPDMRSAESK